MSAGKIFCLVRFFVCLCLGFCFSISGCFGWVYVWFEVIYYVVTGDLMGVLTLYFASVVVNLGR